MGQNSKQKQICIMLIKASQYVKLIENYHDFMVKMIIKNLIMTIKSVLLLYRSFLQTYKN